MTNRRLTLALQAWAVPALGFDAKTCEEAGVGLASIATPIAKNHVALYEGQVTVYNIDQIEPACCSKGIAVVLPAARTRSVALMYGDRRARVRGRDEGQAKL